MLSSGLWFIVEGDGEVNLKKITRDSVALNPRVLSHAIKYNIMLLDIIDTTPNRSISV